MYNFDKTLMLKHLQHLKRNTEIKKILYLDTKCEPEKF